MNFIFHPMGIIKNPVNLRICEANQRPIKFDMTDPDYNDLRSYRKKLLMIRGDTIFAGVGDYPSQAGTLSLSGRDTILIRLGHYPYQAGLLFLSGRETISVSRGDNLTLPSPYHLF